jgi:hypothetical protein
VAFFARLGVGPGGLLPGSRSAVRHKTFDMDYDTPLRAAPAVAAALVVSQGAFSGATGGASTSPRRMLVAPKSTEQLEHVGSYRGYP